MGFPFAYVCDLLESIETCQTSCAPQEKTPISLVRAWFGRHRTLVHSRDTDAAALLSTLLPEKRTDRVYSIQARSLEKIIGRALALGYSRIAELTRWDKAGSGVDLADCVEGILRCTPNPMFTDQAGITIEEIDEALHNIAARCQFSSPLVRSSSLASEAFHRSNALGELYVRVQAREAKWLTRLILKDYRPVILDPHVVYRSYHPSLTSILRVHDKFDVALKLFKRHTGPPSPGKLAFSGRELARELGPIVGVKVGRQPWFKARSIKHCKDMASGWASGWASCEKKVDGEYCQVHIDLAKGNECIQIFSKSGKDSTQDRIKLRHAIRTSMRLDRLDCPIRESCILEGELVVYSELEEKILDFHKIRKYVSRSGKFIGTEGDSQQKPYEHLMIVYFDVLSIDGDSLLGVKQSERFRRLQSLITCKRGVSALVERHPINLGRSTAGSELREMFAKCIVSHEEGLVLKPDHPYFDFSEGRKPYGCCCIKLKKEYIGSFGDIGDFAVIGARYDAVKASMYGFETRWTHFFIGCLSNKTEVERWNEKPRFIVTNEVELNNTQLETFVKQVDPRVVSRTDDEAFTLHFERGVAQGKRPTDIFVDPPVFDIRCFSFDKGGNTGFWSPRFPQVSKIHSDGRTYLDVLAFDELQEMAKAEKEAPCLEDSQDMAKWISALKKADPERTHAASLSQSTATTAMTQSPMAPSSPEYLGTTTRRTTGGVVRGSALIPSRPPTSRFQLAALTPPRSSDTIEEEQETTRPTSFTQGAKRAGEEPEGMRKRRRTSGYLDAATPLSEVQSSSQSQPRRPLGDITMSSCPRDNTPSQRQKSQDISGSYESSQGLSVPQEHGPPAPLASNRSTSDKMAKGVHTTSLSNATNEEAGLDPPRTSSSTTTASCCHLGQGCAFTNCSFSLSPCISQFAWVTENLLSYHGINHAVLDPSAWSSKPAPAQQTTTVMPPRRPRTRRIALVEYRRKEATEQFLCSIKALKLKRPNGEKEWVEVYDWRLLEAVTKAEAKGGRREARAAESAKGPGSAREIWRKYWIGLV